MADVQPAVTTDGRAAPAAGFRFGLEIEGLVVGWFTECGGLSIERTVVPYEEGGVNDYVHQLPGQIKRTNITLKRGIADDTLWGWFQQGLYDGKVQRRNISIILYGEPGGVDEAEAGRWDLTGAYPLKWTGPDLKAYEDRVAVEVLEIGSNDGTSARGSGFGSITGMGSSATSAVQRQAEGTSSASSSTEQKSTMGQEIDLPALANKVYDLFRQELRRERERSGST